ncbi:hypothetical protein HK57_00124 [Aspergillus ustus]|uniref:Enoyl reductase (ER) domain-containing protein n=1 Tax=Aspergillus ustus TaxID=40382 RepID=A0A0C1C2Z8_ASPUT|nr:hypothetical protein HK57_00124 [Aspergillus ustus]
MGSTSNGLDEVTTAIAELSTIDASDPATRYEIVDKCQRILDILQDPLAVVMENLCSIVKFPCLAVLNRLEVFKRLTSGPLTASELAEQTNSDRWLIVRLMRAATAWGLVKEIGPETYQATPVTHVFAAPPCVAGLRVGEKIHKILDSLPTYLEETDFRNPASATNGLFQYAFGTDQESFDFFATDEKYTQDFNTFMTIQRTRGQNWTDQFNAGSRILDGIPIDQTVPLVVDVAGGVGQDLTLVKNALPLDARTAVGQLVLQDLPQVIDNVPAELHDPDFEYIKHDIFTPQPVKGARFYMMKHILHNWPDDRALKILRNIATAVTPGYSKLWILDSVVPDTGADKAVVALDIAMLGFHGAQERNREQWTTLLAAAGFEIVDLSVLPDGFGLIEAVINQSNSLCIIIITAAMSVPSSFKAALLNEGSQKHTISSRSLGPLGKDEVAIRITATAINPVDWKIRDHGYFLKTFPAILGSDAAGEIVSVGESVADFAPGDRVFFQGIIGNYAASTFQQYCRMPAALVGKTPAAISDDQAAGICLATVAGVTGLYDKTGRGLAPPPWAAGGERAGNGKAIVVLGGSSSVGQYVIQLARLAGYERIVTNASLTHAERLKSHGAHVVLDRKQAGPRDFISAVNDLPLDFVFDTISMGETQKLGVDILHAANAQQSCVVTVLAADAEAQKLGSAREPKVEIRQILGLGSNPALRYLSEPLMKNLGGEDGWLASGKFVPNRPVVVDGGLEKLDEALDKNKAGISGEKVVIRP